MKTFSDEQLLKWSTLYQVVNTEYDLINKGVDLDLFLQQPEVYCRWIRIYVALDRRYQIDRAHDCTFLLFLQNPALNQKWIPLYLDNPLLFKYRQGEWQVLLVSFLQNNPREIFKERLQRHMRHTGIKMDFLPLLPAQSKIKAIWDKLDKYYLRDVFDRFYFHRKNQGLECHGDPLIQPMHHRVPPKKYKTGGTHA